MKKIKLKRLKSKKIEALVGLIFFIGFVAIGAAIFAGTGLEETTTLPDSVPATPTPAVAPQPAPENPQVEPAAPGSDGSQNGFVTKKISYRVPVGVNAATATQTNYNPPSNPANPGSDTPGADDLNPDDEFIDEDYYEIIEEILDPDDIEEINESDISEEEPIPDDLEGDEFEEDDEGDEGQEGNQEEGDQGDEGNQGENGNNDEIGDYDELDPDDITDEEGLEEQVPDDMPGEDELEDFLNG